MKILRTMGFDKNTITNNNNPPTTSSQQQPQPQPQPQQPQLHTLSPLNQIQAATSATPSVSTKNASKRNYKTSSTSSKLRSTTSKLFDKKGHNQEDTVPFLMILTLKISMMSLYTMTTQLGSQRTNQLHY